MLLDSNSILNAIDTVTCYIVFSHIEQREIVYESRTTQATNYHLSCGRK